MIELDIIPGIRSKSSPARFPWTLGLLAAALLAGGWRDPRLAAAGEAGVFAAAWSSLPPLGPAAPWLPWLAWALLCAAASAQPLAALPFAARWSAALAFFSLAAKWDERQRRSWLAVLLAAGLALAAAALWTGAPLGFRAGMTGLLPPYYNYTSFAVAAAAAAAAAWALHPRAGRPGPRLAALAVAALGIACLFLARSRAAALGVAFAAAVWAARRWGARAALAAAVAAGLAGGAYRAGLLPASWRAAAAKEGRRYQEARPEIWRRAAEMAREKPWFGEGPGSFGAGFRRRPVEAIGGAARWGLETPFAHSEPLQAAAETGVVGLALWLIAFGASLSALLGRARDEPAREAAAAAVAAMAVCLAFDNMLQLPGLALLFFSALAVAGAPSPTARRWGKAAAAAGVLLAAVSWIPRALAGRDPARAAAVFPAESGPREDLAYRAMAAGRLSEADAEWSAAARLAPFDAIYPWRRAQIAAAQGRWSDAEALVRGAAELEPGFMSARVLRAEALCRLGRRPEARAELTDVLRRFHERGNRIGGSGYERAVWDFDRAQYDRVAALSGLRGAAASRARSASAPEAPASP